MATDKLRYALPLVLLLAFNGVAAGQEEWTLATAPTNVISNTVKDFVSALTRHFKTNAGITIRHVIVQSMEFMPMESGLLETAGRYRMNPSGKEILFMVTLDEMKAGLWCGAGLDQVLDEKTRADIISDEMEPLLRKKRTGMAIMKGTEAVSAALAGKIGLDMSPYPQVKKKIRKKTEHIRRAPKLPTAAEAGRLILKSLLALLGVLLVITIIGFALRYVGRYRSDGPDAGRNGFGRRRRGGF